MSVRLIPLNLGLENQDINEAIVGTTAPPLCSSKGGTAHGEQERNFKLVIRGQKRKEPNGHNSGKTKEIMKTITCLLQRATVWCEQTEVPTVKPAQLKYSRDVLLDNVMRWYTNYLVVGQTGQIGQSLNSRCTKKEMSVTCGFGISFSCAAIHNRLRKVVFVVIVCRIDHMYPAAQEKDLPLNCAAVVFLVNENFAHCSTCFYSFDTGRENSSADSHCEI